MKAKHETKNIAIILILFTTLLTSAAQLLYKFGASGLNLSFAGIVYNKFFILGTLIYFIAGALAFLSFRNGEVTVIYPILATSYVWVAIFSVYLLGEKVNLFKIIGILTIVGGVSLIGFSRNKIEAAQ